MKTLATAELVPHKVNLALDGSRRVGSQSSLHSVLKHNQQDATLYNALYFRERSTYFKREQQTSLTNPDAACKDLSS